MKTRIQDRFDNAHDAFFEPVVEEGSLTVESASNGLSTESREPVTVKLDRWSNKMRLAFLFLPGSFILYYSLLSTYFFYPEFGLTPQMIFMIFGGAFMCLAGVGNIKESKNLSAPAAIIAVASAVALVGSLFSGPLQSDVYFWYSIYLFPIALIAARASQILYSPPRHNE